MATNHKSTRAMKKSRTDFRAQCEAEDAPCWMDGQPIDYTAPFDDWKNDNRFQLDHYYPVSTHPELQEDPTNYRASHAGCNSARGNGSPTAGLGTLSEQWT